MSKGPYILVIFSNLNIFLKIIFGKQSRWRKKRCWKKEKLKKKTI